MFTFTHRNPEMRLDKDHTALVLADIQNEFLQPGEQPREPLLPAPHVVAKLIEDAVGAGQQAGDTAQRFERAGFVIAGHFRLSHKATELQVRISG